MSELAYAAHRGRAEDPPSLDLPIGRRMELGSRGTTFYRELPGPPGAPTLVLLHGWVASGGLNWFQTFETLGQHFRVIAPDLRGHGRGIRSWRRFRLADCADDTAQLLTHLGVKSAIAVGYSMGGAVGQLLWHRHPELVSGLVMCATGDVLLPIARHRVIFSGMMATLAGTTRVGQLSARLPRSYLENWLSASEGRSRRPSSFSRWAAAEMGRHDFRMVLEAGIAISNYDASAWIRQVDVPTAVMVTTQDRAIGPEPQLQLAWSIPDAVIHPVDDGHTFCARAEFAEPLLQACTDVAERADILGA